MNPESTKMDIDFTIKAYLDPTIVPFIDCDETKKWYNKQKQLHRTNGPAVIYKTGIQYYYNHGKMHRKDGPAVIWANGDKEYWINDNRLTEEEFKDYVSAKNK